MEKILITGATGYIGSHVSLILLLNGFEIVGIDSFENSSPKSISKVLEILTSDKKNYSESINIYKGDIRDKQFLKKVFTNEEKTGNPIKAVIHLAALKSVFESVLNPLKYWDYNVFGSMNLFEIMSDFNCKTIVFSSSATVYKSSDELMDEDTPIDPINPYGTTKAVVENLLKDLFTSFKSNWKVINLRYFNPIGAHPSGLIGEDPKSISTNIFPLIAGVASKKIEKLNVFGNDWDTPDGTCIRDYIHIMDLAEGHLSALKYLMQNTKKFMNINLGTGCGVSVLKLISTFEKVNNSKVDYVFADRRSGDKVMSVADNSLATKILSWRPSRSLDQMCRDGWNWQKLNPNGYE